MSTTAAPSVTIRLPWPPSVNHYWANRVCRSKGGRKAFIKTYISKRGVAFQEQVAAAIKRRFGGITGLTGPLQVVIVMHAPTRHSYDIDNLAKAPLDSLTKAGVWVDDKQVCHLTLIRGPVSPPGWIEVTITRIEGEQQGRLTFTLAEQGKINEPPSVVAPNGSNQNGLCSERARHG